MKLIHRYIFYQVAIASILAVSLFVFVLVFGNAIRDVIGLLAGGKLSWTFFLQLLSLLIPYVFSYALPMGILSGILIVLGRLSSQREITAMKASGLSLLSIAMPIFVLAAIGTLLSLLINFYYAPLAKTIYRQQLAQVIREDPIRFIQPHTFIHDFPGYIIYIDTRKNDNSLSNFWIWELDSQDRLSILIQAQKGKFEYDADRDDIVLTLEKGIGEKRHKDNPEEVMNTTLPMLTFETFSIRLPFNQILKQNHFNKKLSMYTLHELLALHNKLIKSVPSEVNPQEFFAERIKIQIQIQKNLAMALSIFAMAAIAIPLGIQASRQETYANLAIALSLALTYYFLVVSITWLERLPDLRPDILIWAPNIIFFALGIALFRRSNQH